MRRRSPYGRASRRLDTPRCNTNECGQQNDLQLVPALNQLHTVIALHFPQVIVHVSGQDGQCGETMMALAVASVFGEVEAGSRK